MRYLLVFGLMASAALAHHSFDAEYDSAKTATLTGVVTKVDWVNPHAYIFFTIKDESGAPKDMRIELGPPYALTRGGWKRDTVKIGDTITVDGGAVAKFGKNWIGALQTSSLVLANGQKMVMR